jgi:hypothetical protein
MVHLALALALLLIFVSRAYKLLLIPWFSVPKDEFAPSLEIDALFLASAPQWVRNLYMRNLNWRRQRAHTRDLA